MNIVTIVVFGLFSSALATSRRNAMRQSEIQAWHLRQLLPTARTTSPRRSYSTITRSLALRPNVSGMYISSALVGGTTKVPGVVGRATYA